MLPIPSIQGLLTTPSDRNQTPISILRRQSHLPLPRPIILAFNLPKLLHHAYHDVRCLHRSFLLPKTLPQPRAKRHEFERRRLRAGLPAFGAEFKRVCTPDCRVAVERREACVEEGAGCGEYGGCTVGAAAGREDGVS